MSHVRIGTTKKRFRFFTGIDLTGATGAAILVSLPDGTEKEWTAVIENPKTSGYIHYDLQEADVPLQNGIYKMVGVIKYADGNVLSDDKACFVGIQKYK